MKSEIIYLVPLSYIDKILAGNRQKFLNFVSTPGNVKRILVFRNGMLGDITFVTSVLNRLINTFPSAEIDVVVGPKATAILENFPNVRKIIPFTFNFSFVSLIRQVIYFLRLHSNRYDIVIVQEVNTHYTILGKLIRPKFLVGFKNSMEYLFDYCIERPKINAVLAEMMTVEEWTRKNDFDKSLLFVSEEELKNARTLLSQYGIVNNEFIVIHTGSNSPDSDRQWVKERYSELADLLVEKYGMKIIFTGVSHDSPNIEDIRQKMKHSSLSLAGKTDVRTLMAVVKISRLVIGIDTGTLHIAAALDTPVIMLMGLADPNDTGVYNSKGTAKIVRVNLPCSPCVHMNPKPAQWEECKNMRPVKCMQMIETNAVIEAVSDIIS